MHSQSGRQLISSKSKSIYQPGRGMVEFGPTSLSDDDAVPTTAVSSVAAVNERKRNERILMSMIVLVGLFAVVEFVVGVVTSSLALRADAFHMVSDLISLIVGLVAVRLAGRKETESKTYGWKRAEVIGGLVNGIFLLSVVFFIVLEVNLHVFVAVDGQTK